MIKIMTSFNLIKNNFNMFYLLILIL